MGRKGPKPKTYNHFQVTLDKFLGSKNLWRKPIAKDGSCLFRAVAEQVCFFVHVGRAKAAPAWLLFCTCIYTHMA